MWLLGSHDPKRHGKNSFPHPTHCNFHGHHVHVARDCLLLSDSNGTFHALVRWAPIWIPTRILPQCSEGISMTKTIHQMHDCTFHISKARRVLLPLFMLPVSSPSQTFNYLYFHKLSALQLKSINHKRHQHKKRPSLGKCAKPAQMLFKSLAPNDLPNNNIVKHCTRALNHPVH